MTPTWPSGSGSLWKRCPEDESVNQHRASIFGWVIDYEPFTLQDFLDTRGNPHAIMQRLKERIVSATSPSGDPVVNPGYLPHWVTSMLFESDVQHGPPEVRAARQQGLWALPDEAAGPRLA